MKNRTVKNMIKATNMIMEKGYDKEKANELAIQCFDNAEVYNYDVPIEWWIERIRKAD